MVEKTDELSRAQRQVVHMEKMASLGKLAATVAHELNNPLAGILNYAKLIDRTLKEGGDDPEEQREVGRFLSVIEKESTRCGAIVKNLLLFARRSGAELALHPVNPIVERAVMLIRHHLEMSGIQLETRLAAGDVRLVCDADQVQQALVALLVNAVEAMSGGGTLTVEAAAVEGEGGEAGGGAVALTVADTGVGIPPDALPHIFEPFFSTKDGTSGAGLGLAVVYGIVHRHGGTIDVDSAPGRGTRFRMVLPGGASGRRGGHRKGETSPDDRQPSAERPHRRRRVLGPRLARALVPEGRLPHRRRQGRPGGARPPRRRRAGTSSSSTSRCRGWTASSCSGASTPSTPRSW